MSKVKTYLHSRSTKRLTFILSYFVSENVDFNTLSIVATRHVVLPKNMSSNISIPPKFQMLNTTTS